MTEDEVREIIAHGNTNHNPINGYVFDGVSANGEAFSIGDVNRDGYFNIADLVAVQKFLSGDETSDIGFWRAANLAEENSYSIDIFDFTALRKLFIDVNLNGISLADSLGEWYPDAYK